MRFASTAYRRVATCSIVLCLLLPMFSLMAAAQTRQPKRVIVVNADQPNLWTLEQAHYLLAQMHRRNLDLRAKKLEALDPNEISGLRFEVMRMLVEFGATFNQADLEVNRLLTGNRAFNSDRRQQLLVERDRLDAEALELAGEVEGLENEKAGTDDEDEKKRLDARIAAKNTRLARVDKRIEQVNAELGTLAAPSGTPTATTGGATFDPSRLPASPSFDDAFKAAAAKQITDFNNAPKLNASLRLDNFLQMQYEIISKQLALLRDELGPGERLVFLELPQTVNSAHHQSKRKWAQSWWKIAGYTRRVPRSGEAQFVPAPTHTAAPNQRPITTEQDVRSILRGEDFAVPLATPPAATPTPTPSASSSSSPSPAQRPMQVSYYDEFVNLDNQLNNNSVLNPYLSSNQTTFENRMVRTVELIPRQSSLNVNDMNLQVKSGAFNFVLSTLFGFGSRLNIQRQREQFSQFVQQELYSAAFGKGSREFGWTFTPMPGTDRLHSGVRTTYAVVVVPEEATSILLESNGCYFPRSYYQPNNFAHTKAPEWNEDDRTSRNCNGTNSKAFLVPIPSAHLDGGNEFWVKAISYQPVGKGKRIVVLITGENFSPQLGVLVNGVPLVHSIGLAQPLIRDDSDAGSATAEDLKNEEVQGRIERVDSNKVVFSFKLPPDIQGTPTITLISPGHAIDINWLTNININGDPPGVPLKDHKPAMFLGAPSTPPSAFRIDRVRVFRGRTRGTLTALVSGAGFLDTAAAPPAPALRQILVNGTPPSRSTYESASLLRLEFPIPDDETIKVTMVSFKPGDPSKEETIESDSLANPALLTVSSVEVVTFETATEDEPATLVVRIRGSGFTDKLKSDVGRIAVRSATEAILTLDDPKAATIVTLEDEDTGKKTKIVVTRKTRRQE